MSETLYVATRKGLFIFEREGQGGPGWRISRTAFLGDNCSMVMADPRDGSLYAALGHGHFGVKLHRSVDEGRSFRPIATPAYPPKPEGDPDPGPGNTELVWELQPGGADQPGWLWCGTIPGGLFHSEDHGETWHLNHALWDDPRRRKWMGGGADHPGLHSICVDPRDPDQVTLGVSCGGVWHSADRGRTWGLRGQGLRAEYMPPEAAHDPVIQDPHLVVRCAAQPECLWTQHHNGIFRSVDGGRSFTEIDPGATVSVFGFAVAVHPRDPQRAWFVPAIKDEQRIPVGGRVVVTHTRDGGRSFTTLDRGLPQEHAYDLVYRHCLDIDGSGARLAFGSTTGSLWLSEDEGQSWQTLSAHLPPIYAVRFRKEA